MAKRFRLRISRVIPSFHSCRSKDDASAAAAAAATAAATPASPVILSAVNPRPLPVSFPTGGDSSAYLWQEEARWHVVARVEPSPRLKIDSDDGGGELFPPLRLQRRPRRAAPAAKKKKMRRARSKPAWAGRGSTSSADTHWFSSEQEDDEEYEEDYDYEEMEALVSPSRSFSTGYSSSATSDFNPRLRPIRESPAHLPHPAAAAAAEGRRSSSASSLLRRFLMMGPPCAGGAAEGKVAESFAVVKRSEDPYGDFRRSIVEMVVEKGMYEEGELEELLRCFLSLNSRRHHAAIVRAFSDVCAALLAPSARSSCVSASATTPPALTSS